MEWYDIEYWLKHFDLHLDPRELLYSRKHNIVVYPETWSVIENLSTDHRLIIISNAAREFIEIEIGELESSFAETFSSVSDFHQTKKEADLYLKLCHSLKIRPGQLYHVGDNYVFDYLVPREVGINAFYLDRDKQRTGEYVVRSLKEFEEKIKCLNEEGL
ncbi:HAD family hydrolase [Chloroflexota bacterium]